MKATISRISEIDFRQKKIPILFEDRLTNHAFGVLLYGRYAYKFSWQSDKVDPVFKQISANIGSVGVDQVFIIFQLDTGKIKRKYFLDYFFYDVKIFKGLIYVMTQLELIIINSKNLNTIQTLALPSYFESIEFGNNLISAKCIDSQIVTVKYPNEKI